MTRRIALAILVPLAAQLAFVFLIIFLTNGTGSFVGLGAMVLGLMALPITAILNAIMAKRKPPWPAAALAARVFLVSAIFPAFITFLYFATS